MGDRRMVSVLLKKRIYYDIVLLESYFGCILIGQLVSLWFCFLNKYFESNFEIYS